MSREKRNSYGCVYGVRKREVLERDHYSCQLCGKTDKLLVHHHDNKGWGFFNYSYSRKTPINNNFDNLVTLCPSCHLKIHNHNSKATKIKADIETIRKLRQSGRTYQAIANIFGVSRQRIHQILMYNQWENYFHVAH